VLLAAVKFVMRALKFILVLFAGLSLSLCLALPAEDVLDTSFDEAEAQPLERASRASETALVSAQSVEAALAGISLQDLDSRTVPSRTRFESNRTPARIHSDLLIILDHFFRC
ncbi:MAG: hypothetical protein ACRD3Q_03385, partial [Terriglobales bacterium]